MASTCLTIPDLLISTKNFEEMQKHGQTRRHLLNYRNEPSSSKNTRHNHGLYSFKNTARKPLDTTKKNQYKYTSLNMEQSPYTNRVKCFKCGTEGHLSRNCTMKIGKKKCFICNQTGHYAKECRIKRISQVTGTNKVNEIKDEYHKLVEVGGKNIVAFLDLGSECSTVVYVWHATNMSINKKEKNTHVNQLKKCNLCKKQKEVCD